MAVRADAIPTPLDGYSVSWEVEARLKVLLKVLVRLLKARLKVLLKALLRLLKARLKVLLQDN